MSVVSLLAATMLAGVGGYAATTHASGTLRLPVLKGKDALWNDWRALLGVGSVVGMMFTGEKSTARSVLATVGTGAFASMATTEAMRFATIRRASNQWGATSARQLPGGTATAALPMGSPVSATPGSSPANPIPAKVSGFGGFGGY